MLKQAIVFSFQVLPNISLQDNFEKAQNNCPAGRELKPVSPMYVAGLPLTQPQHSILFLH
jgi:hypothetical protein